VIKSSKEGGVRPPANEEDDLLAPGAKPQTVPGGATVPANPPPIPQQKPAATQPVAGP
jgi:hypothetical protein